METETWGAFVSRKKEVKMLGVMDSIEYGKNSTSRIPKHGVYAMVAKHFMVG